MQTPPHRAEVIALVRSSPTFVAAHDKEGWLGIFGAQHVVEDPVGALPVRSEDRGALATFWDAFIAPNDVEFRVVHDWIDGFDVVRDVTIVTTLPTGVQVSTPPHLIYQTGYQDGELKVRRMAAHWETAPVLAQLARPTRAHLGAAAGQGVHLVRTLGAVPAIRFFATVRSVGRRGKKAVLDHLTEQGIGPVSKIIASGNCVTASITVDGAPAAVIARVAPRSRDLVDVRIYTDLV
ncbi:hypothetical protein [Aeromicrobium sp. A1-2]|uniref:hypothetical protein n=1 Tax=Aeromicrobium sp. A1-2 TaxID=2107713 RepID=UPI001C1FC26C|nr:hypothetical protein [Aeromicrobium sp. A1-2]